MTPAQRAERIEVWYLRGSIAQACETIQYQAREQAETGNLWAKTIRETIMLILQAIKPAASAVIKTAENVDEQIHRHRERDDDDDEPWRKSLRDDY